MDLKDSSLLIWFPFHAMGSVQGKGLPRHWWLWKWWPPPFPSLSGRHLHVHQRHYQSSVNLLSSSTSGLDAWQTFSCLFFTTAPWHWGNGHSLFTKKENRGSEKLSCLCSQANKWLSRDFNSDLCVPEPEMVTTCLYHFSGEAVWQGWICAGNLQLWQSLQRWPWTWFLDWLCSGVWWFWVLSLHTHFTYTCTLTPHHLRPEWRAGFTWLILIWATAWAWTSFPLHQSYFPKKASKQRLCHHPVWSIWLGGVSPSSQSIRYTTLGPIY